MPTLANAALPELIHTIEQNSVRVRRQFGQLKLEQLSWKPAPQEWSIGQCLAHLTISNSSYFSELRAITQGRRRPRLQERIPGLPHLWAAFLLRALDPQAPMAVPAPPAFQPPASISSPELVNEFLSAQLTIVDLMRASDGHDLERTIITSPIAPIITYTLIDTYRIIAVHELLHIQQAERVMRTAGFPG